MTSVADDYENLPIIIEVVTNWAKGRNVFPAREEVVNAIETLTVEGHVQSYWLSPHAPHAAAVQFDRNRVDDLYFYLTPAGKKIVKNTEELGVSE